MIGLLCFGLAVLASPFKSKLRLEAENAALRHQLIVLRPSSHAQPQSPQRPHLMFKSASPLRPFGALEKGSQVSWPGCGRSKCSALGRPPRAVWIRLALPMLANARLLQASRHGNDVLTIEPSAAHRPRGGLLCRVGPASFRCNHSKSGPRRSAVMNEISESNKGS